jgi:pyridoxine 5-phosphate synthase
MIRLGVNIDHVATIRQARGTRYPDLLSAARLAQTGGADQITIHLREDRRHIQDEDVRILKNEGALPLNLEMAAVPEIAAIAATIGPYSVTFVPEKREEKTTERGVDLVTEFQLVSPHVEALKKAGIAVSLFIDPDEEQVNAATELRVSAVELHTGPYSIATNIVTRDQELERIRRSARLARKRGLKVAAGHGLNYENTKTLVKTVPEIEELNIGHAIVARAIFVGLDHAVKEMKDLLI